MLLNLDRARERMQQHGVDALVAALPENVLYLTDCEGHLTTGLFAHSHTYEPAYYAVLPLQPDRPATFLTPASSFGYLIDEPTWVPEVRLWGDAGRDLPDPETLHGDAKQYVTMLREATARALPGPAIKALAQVIGELGLNRARLAIDDERVSVRLREQDEMGATLLPGYDLFREVRAVKTPDELERLRKASDANELALEALLTKMQPGVSWWDLKVEYETTMIKAGAVPRFWGSASGPYPWRFNLFQAESPAMDQLIHEGDVLKLDVGGTYRNYWSDTNRTAVVRGKMPEWLPRAAKALQEARDAYSQHLRPGVPMGKSIDVYEKVVWQHGFNDFRAAWGHGLGLQCYDFPKPRIQRDTEPVFEENMVFNMEGGPGVIGQVLHSLENTYRITATGFERWSHNDGVIREIS